MKVFLFAGVKAKKCQLIKKEQDDTSEAEKLKIK